jgi:hypothetical protein
MSITSKKNFVRVGVDLVVEESDILELDCTELQLYRVSVLLRTGRRFDLEGQQALDLVMAIKPSAVEGKRLRFARQAWAFHNLIAHPGLQILVWLGLTKLGMKLHDSTIPRPLL